MEEMLPYLDLDGYGQALQQVKELVGKLLRGGNKAPVRIEAAKLPVIPDSADYMAAAGTVR